MRESPIHCLTPPLTTVARAGPDQSSERGTPSGFPVLVKGVHAFGQSSVVFPDIIARSWTGSRTARTEKSNVTWDAGITSCSKTLCIMIYTLKLSLNWFTVMFIKVVATLTL